jgi:S-adenosylmethionine:tRNA ribosyltransferase-isomerase
VYFDDRYYLTAVDEPGPVERKIAFDSSEDEATIIAKHGRVPLPPYIRRDAGESDIERYQTVYARQTGSVAAPTAGLHFDDEIFSRLGQKGISHHTLTLHVGPGTFKPVTVDDIEEHIVDPEFATVTAETAESVNREKESGKRLIAVGTTSIRTLESAADENGELHPVADLVDLFIYPGYKYRIVDAMLTNFHLPKSSLLMLVAAFCGREFLFEAYRHAIAEKYRFYSYGDCMLII